MTYASIPYLPFQYDRTLTPLEQAIVKRTDYGTINYKAFDFPEITAPLRSIANAVESAFVLVAKGDIPKARDIVRIGNTRSFSFEGEPWSGVKVNAGATAKAARSMAIKWLSIAAHIEAEEKIEAKKKADAECAAKVARAKELDRIATLHFGKPISELSTNKTSAIEAIYDLEQKLADQKDAA